MKKRNVLIVLLLSLVLVFSSTVCADAKTTVGKVNGLYADPDASSVFIMFNSVKNADGYKVYISKDDRSNFKCVKTLKGSSTTYASIDSLSPNNFYYVKVRAYKNVSGKKVYGSYSSSQLFSTKFSDPTYAGTYVSYPNSSIFASLDIENSNYSRSLEVDVNSAYLYDVNTGSVICGLSAYYYSTSEEDSLHNVYSSTVSIPAGKSYFLTFKQCVTSIDASKDFYGIAYRIKYNGKEYLAKTEIDGTEVSLLSWKSTF